ncbi:twin-arginine translocation signal domain-containing protein [Modestobacter marinus]|nr:twin-arginine translocation signal domain-containing protein [Modestobacter marinus]
MTDIVPARRRLLLPLLNTVRHGSRSNVTCYYKCGNACDHPVPNATTNPTIGEVVEGAFSRRTALKAAGVGALVVTAGQLQTPNARAAELPFQDWRPGLDEPLTFEPVEQNLLDELVTATG